MQSKPVDRDRDRWLHRLAVIGDATLSGRVRLAAIRAVQARLPDQNPLKLTKADRLLESVKWPWETKYTNRGDVVVARPAQSLDDLWE